MTEDISFHELLKKRVHIAPVGFEHDRIVEPIILGKADKVWLLKNGSDNGKTGIYLERVVESLKSSKILFEIKEVNMFSMIDILNSINEIIELEQKNEIFVNISSGSKITAVALALACMLWEGTPYYVMPKKYPTHIAGKTLSEGVKDIISVPKFQIISPEIEHLDVLNIIKQSGGSIKKKDLIERLIEIGQIKSDISDQGKYNILNRKFLSPLFKNKDISFNENDYEIGITKEGEIKLKIFSSKI